MTTLPCPFCGVATEVPHETQERCIEALHAEIHRLRCIVEKVRHAPAGDGPGHFQADLANTDEDGAGGSSSQ